ncbi:unnamed protein product [Blepharisma stoltei]|uniref:RING-type domain-containing protein n=1 Tax=Blepharisma stoltei TaxID=1481888 RepID=A0AAU9J8D7_9CILI|nr:unnamed protein product [Blepharisma stoltei]
MKISQKNRKLFLTWWAITVFMYLSSGLSWALTALFLEIFSFIGVLLSSKNFDPPPKIIDYCSICKSTLIINTKCGHYICQECFNHSKTHYFDNGQVNCYFCSEIIPENLPLKDQGDMEIHTNEDENKFQCSIDMNFYPVSKEFRLSCDHSYCKDCLVKYLKEEIETCEGFDTMVTCRRCSEEIKNFEVFGLFSFNEFMNFLKRKSSILKKINIPTISCKNCGLWFCYDLYRKSRCPNPICLQSAAKNGQK